MLYVCDETNLEDDLYEVLWNHDLADYLGAVMDLFRSSDEIVWVEDEEEV